MSFGVNCSISHQMWTQLQAYYQQISKECITALQEQYYSYKLTAQEFVTTTLASFKNLLSNLPLKP